VRAQVGACILGCTLAALLGAAVTILVNNHRAAEAWQARVSALQGQVCKAYEELYVRGDRPQHALYSQVCSTPAGPCGERTADMVQPPNTDFSASCRRDVSVCMQAVDTASCRFREVCQLRCFRDSQRCAVCGHAY